MSDEMVVWTPKEFSGNDILPALIDPSEFHVTGIPDMLGRENIDPDDMVVPSLNLLHGTSDAVENKVPDAEAGLFMHTGTEEVLPEGALRLIFVHYHKSNALFPKDDPRYQGLETCRSPDQVRGDVYGLCKDCGKCYDWDEENNLPPLGAQTHNFVAMTSMGPVMMRFSKSNYDAGNRFITSWKQSGKKLFTHPVVIRVLQKPKELKGGKTTMYFTVQIAWQTTEKVPDALQLAAYELYKEVHAKYETGHLKSDENEPADAEKF